MCTKPSAYCKGEKVTFNLVQMRITASCYIYLYIFLNIVFSLVYFETYHFIYEVTSAIVCNLVVNPCTIILRKPDEWN